MTTMLREPDTGPAAWTGAEMRASDEWIHRLSDAEIGELDAALASVKSNRLGLYDVTLEDFPLPTLSPVIDQWVHDLEDGRGFILVKGLPIDRYSEADASTIYWGIGQHMGLPVSQNAAGDLLGHVRDTGRSIADPSVRGYQTRIRLPYHTDGSDVVGLLCFRPAKSGGLSSIVSSTTVFNEVVWRRPDLVELMYEPFFYDRREEQAPGEEPWYQSPIASYVDDKLSIRYIRGFIESAQRFPEVPRLTDRQRELLDLVDSITMDPDVELLTDSNLETCSSSTTTSSCTPAPTTRTSKSPSRNVTSSAYGWPFARAAGSPPTSDGAWARSTSEVDAAASDR